MGFSSSFTQINPFPAQQTALHPKLNCTALHSGFNPLPLFTLPQYFLLVSLQLAHRIYQGLLKMKPVKGSIILLLIYMCKSCDWDTKYMFYLPATKYCKTISQHILRLKSPDVDHIVLRLAKLVGSTMLFQRLPIFCQCPSKETWGLNKKKLSST